MAPQSADAVSVRLGAVAGRQQAAALDGFKARTLRTDAQLPVRDERRWHYEVDWSCFRSADIASASMDVRLLALGAAPSTLASSNADRGSASVAADALRNGTPHGLLLTSPMEQGEGERVLELTTMAGAVRLLQVLALQGAAIPVWMCTVRTQPTPGGGCEHAHAGLWGLARACRQEHATLPVWCADADESGGELMKVVRSHTLWLSGGSVRGLQSKESLEPEIACAVQRLHAPRLVAPYHAASSATLCISLEMAHCILKHYLSGATAELDMQTLMPAYALLGELCQQYVKGATVSTKESMVRLWHHKLLLGWCAAQPSSEHAVTAPADVRAAHRGVWAEVQLAERCGPSLVAALTAEVAYQELLFPGGSMKMVLPVYEDATISMFYNGCVIAAVEAVVALLDGVRLIVALEVGAGTGGTASSVLPSVSSACTRYIFTDVSEVFLRQARARFGGFLFVEYMLLNIDASPLLQGLARGQCDLLIATNVLHATPYIRCTLAHCAELLLPGGILVVNEALATSPFIQISFGMTDGWWLFGESRDPERIGQGSPLLVWRQWQALLADSNLYCSFSLQGDAFLRCQAVIVAQSFAVEEGGGGASIVCDHFLSGGLGGLGLLTARRLAEHGARHLVLSSRSGRVVLGSEGDWTLLEERGSKIWRVRCDVSDDGAVRPVKYQLRGAGLRFGGVMHAAHQLADATLVNQQLLHFRSAYGPKVHGSAVLHATASDVPLHAYNLYSSVAGLMGSAGQAPHSAANAWLDVMAGWRRRRGVCGQSVNWGAVAEIGYAARHGADRRAEILGSGTISRAVAIASLDNTLAAACRSFAVMPIDWSRLLGAGREACGVLTPYAHLGGHGIMRGAHVVAAESRETLTAAEARPATTHALDPDTVLELVRRTAGGHVDEDAPLMDAGVDSLGAVELRNQLQSAVGEGMALPSTLVFDHPTARMLGIFVTATATPPVASSCDQPRHVPDALVTIASASATLPRGAAGLSLAWRLAATGWDACGPSPFTRWDSPSTVMRYGAFLEGAELFDNTVFGVSSPETSTMDPQQRLLLELGYAAVHSAVLPRDELMGSDTAVYVGVMSTEFRQVVPHSNAYTMTGTGHCFAAGRLSYLLGLNGACEAIDVACSAALVACHHGRNAVQAHDCNDAIVAGVNMMFAPSTLDGFAAAGLTSPLGKAYVFDARAEGFVRAEGCGTCVFRANAEQRTASIHGSGPPPPSLSQTPQKPIAESNLGNKLID